MQVSSGACPHAACADGACRASRRAVCRSRRVRRSVTAHTHLPAGLAVCVTLGVLASLAAPAGAAVTHAFIPGASAAIGQVMSGGPPSSVSAMTVDEGHLWVAEGI